MGRAGPCISDEFMTESDRIPEQKKKNIISNHITFDPKLFFLRKTGWVTATKHPATTNVDLHTGTPETGTGPAAISLSLVKMLQQCPLAVRVVELAATLLSRSAKILFLSESKLVPPSAHEGLAHQGTST